MALKKISESELITACAYTAACCSLLGGCEVTAGLNAETNRREYLIKGDFKSALKRLLNNEPLGSFTINKELIRLRGLVV